MKENIPAGYLLPLTVLGETPGGEERRRVWVRGAETAVEFPADVTRIRLDPDSLLLLKH